ncbi:MAG: PEGA domain-containing protein [Fimbriimonadaceae bacterium]|nr:PEGA domain-containing protein [Fimbriimonadaceae bacterium]
MSTRWCLLLWLAVAGAQAGQYHVLTIGVSNYDHDSITDLNFAATDALTVAERFARCGIPKRNIRVLLSADFTPQQREQHPLLTDSARPTRGLLRSRLRKLRDEAQAGDTVIVFFSGHGLCLEQTSYLLTSDTDPDDVPGTALAVKEAEALLSGLAAANVLLLIDACRNDPRAGKGDEDGSLEAGFSKDLRLRLELVPNLTTVMACSVGQRAWEIPEERQGVFAHYLLQAFDSARSPDGQVRLGGLVDKVQGGVSDWNRTHPQKSQLPQAEKVSGNWEFVVLPARPKSKLRITVTPAAAKVFRKRPDEPAGQLLGTTPLEVDGEAGEEATYSVVLPGYQTERLELALDPGMQSASIKLRTAPPPGPKPVALPPAAEALVQSRPAGATVWLGGDNLGVTPLLYRGPAGALALRVTLPDHEDRSFTTTLVAGKQTPVMADLTRLVGQVLVNASVAGAEIWVDRAKLDQSTPAMLVLPTGEHQVEVRASGVRPATQTVIVRAGQLVTPPSFRLDPLLAEVRLQSVPEGAAIWLRDATGALTDSGRRTPESVTFGVPFERQVVLRRDGYKEAVLNVTAAADRPTVLPSVKLEALPATVVVSSVPARARILLDGQDTERTTPATLTVPAGPHTIRLALPGYRASEFALTATPAGVHSPEPVELAAVLGRLRITATPAGASVELPGRPPLTAPCELELPPGEYPVAGRQAGYLPGETKVVVRPDELTSASLELQPAPVEVRFTSAPPGAKVSFGLPDQTLQVAPGMVKLLPGTYRARFELPGYLPADQPFVVQLGQPLSLPAVTLQKVPEAPRPAVVEAPKPPPKPPFRLPDYLPAAALRPSLSYRICPSDAMPQVWIPAAEFIMGASAADCETAQRSLMLAHLKFDDDCFRGFSPERQVQLSGYWIDLHEVTNQQFVRFLNDRKPTDAERRQWCVVRGEARGANCEPEIEKSTTRFLVRKGFENHPATFVTWLGAQAYAAWAGRSLPSEAQWERAARGGVERELFAWEGSLPGQGAGNFADRCLMQLQNMMPKHWWSYLDYDDGFARLAPVGSFDPNAYGLVDVAGNASEWCRDAYDGRFYQTMPSEDPVNAPAGGPPKIAVARGGNFMCPPYKLLFAHRDGFETRRYPEEVGFRLVSSDPAPAP